ncbi:hypothetical protein P2G88_14390 [Aliiglaciecola sp. CAU 1673]|uniref:hypothetical protein n=1 Tax=Aliiglaciecola sp. CAU 1673 TaxID=3032595 RepID=UPI0023DC4562|nr:hypothetical protein [Aliiglaciecola sp. CAU 1673]MDF2179440.1 hypothetical protein [Aliiglaciecola sp. CAU 1673]
MNKLQMIEAFKDIEKKFKRNLEVAEEVWEPSSPFMEVARKQAAKVMEQEIAELMREI